MSNHTQKTRNILFFFTLSLLVTLPPWWHLPPQLRSPGRMQLSAASPCAPGAACVAAGACPGDTVPAVLLLAFLSDEPSFLPGEFLAFLLDFFFFFFKYKRANGREKCNIHIHRCVLTQHGPWGLGLGAEMSPSAEEGVL